MTHANEQYQHLKSFKRELPEWGSAFVAISKEMDSKIFVLRDEPWMTRAGRMAPSGLWMRASQHVIWDEEFLFIKGKSAAMDYLRAFYVFWIPFPPPPPDLVGGSHD